jgi:hypothetical protein
MKKLLLAGFLSFAALGATTTPASAWGLLERLGGLHCCGKCTSVICCRQYNAFTPVCFGSITCIGCSPLNACGGGMPMCSPPCNGYPPVPYCGPSCDAGACSASDCCSGGVLPAPGSFSTSPPPNTFVPPMPNPVATTSQMYPMMGRGMVQPVAYQTGYYPAPYYGYRPTMMPQVYPMQGGYRPMYPQQMGGSFPNAFFGGN